MRTSDAADLWGFILEGIDTPDLTTNDRGCTYITRTTALKIYSPLRTLVTKRVNHVFDLEMDISTPVAVHVSLDRKLMHMGMRLVDPLYLAPGVHTLQLLVDVVSDSVRVGRGQCVVHLDARSTQQRFSIKANGLYKECE